ncbi:hypothetical protein F5Y12DRAFT_437335 [Xylaria sp. FL1777]|nr:hypothetical protein F5Y12DRAFT_437335 [Xylaria sp. FL1777]
MISPMGWVTNGRVSLWDGSIVAEEILGLESPPQQNENNYALSTGTDSDSMPICTFDTNPIPSGMDEEISPPLPLEPLGAGDQGSVRRLEDCPLTQIPILPLSLEILDHVAGGGQPQPVYMPAETQGPGLETSLGPCGCLEDLTSGLLTCDLWEAAGTAETASPTDIIQALAFGIFTYLSTFKNWIKIWDIVRRCQSYCLIRHDYAPLFILNLNRIVKLQMRLITTLSYGESYDPSSPAELYVMGNDQRYIPNRSTTDEAQLQTGSSSIPFIPEETYMGSDHLAIDGIFSHSSIIKELLRSRIDRLQTSIQVLRGEWTAAGLGDCSAKLDLVSSALTNQVSLLRDNPI